MNWKFATVSAACAMLATGCAELQIYKDEGLQTRAGIPFYVQKPYLLVSRTGAKEKPIDISVVYINDLSRPRYAKIQPGLLGSSETTLAFQNSALTAVGQKSDAQLDELLTAYGGLATSLATAGKTERETDLLGNQSADYGALGAQLRAIETSLKTAIAGARSANVLTTLELQTLQTALGVITTSAAILEDPTQASAQAPAVLISLKNVSKNWEATLKAASTATSGPEPLLRRQISTLKEQLDAVIKKLSPEEAEKPSFSLYEIDNSTGSTVLKEVTF